MNTPLISVSEALALQNALFVDTRSPGEFVVDHIPGAINLPIFDNDQRAQIGTLYKHNKDKAYEMGLKMYEQKTAKLIDTISSFDTKKKIVVYCWRGGLRSKTITELVRKQGYNALQLEGGYKSFRAFVREELHSFKPAFRFVVLHGLAGCGKTDLIKQLHPAIDLEGIARHRSSLFGAIGLEPNNQKNFETQLYFQLKAYEDEPYVFIEGESHKVGKVYIPQNIFAAMKEGIAVRVNATNDCRVKRIVEDYFTHGEDEEIIRIIDSLRATLSNKVTDELIALVKEKNYSKVSEVLLLDYYDSRYEHGMKDLRFELTINNDDVMQATQRLQEYIKKIH